MKMCSFLDIIWVLIGYSDCKTTERHNAVINKRFQLFSFFLLILFLKLKTRAEFGVYALPGLVQFTQKG